MNKLMAIFASALFAVSLFVAPVSAVETNQAFNEQVVNNAELQKCFESGRAGCR